MRILRLTAENFKRLEVIDITPGARPVVTITGRNGAGKSSVLDALVSALSGKAASPEVPIRKGQPRAEVVVELQDLIVTRKWSRSGTTLVVQGRDGRPRSSPQAILDDLIRYVAFDPLRFANARPADQIQILLELAGQDFQDLDQRRIEFRELRNSATRGLRSQAAILEQYRDLPDQVPEPVSTSDLLQRYHDGIDAKKANDATRERYDDTLLNIQETQETIQDLRDQIRSLEKTLEALRFQEQRLKAQVDQIQDPDLDAIMAEIKGSEARNRIARRAQEAAQIRAGIQALEAQAREAQQGLEGLEAEQNQILAGLNLPARGLEISSDRETVLLDGVPFAQASQAQRLLASVAIGLAQNPGLRVAVIRDGSALDLESLQALHEWAEQTDSQVWIERVSDDPKAAYGVVIEAGSVAADTGD